LAWQPFSEERLAGLLAEHKTVLIDFTADWCTTCKFIEATALNTKETKNLVEQFGVVTLYADNTNESAEVEKWLTKFGSKSVPLTVIFPGNDPKKPILLRDLYTQSRLLESLKAAGPSQGGSGAAVSANPPAKQPTTTAKN
jgi:thiol:disulfide interchange protein DsbD